MNFIVVDAYSPYTVIVAMLWLHAIGVVPSILHLKVKYPFENWVEKMVRSQPMVRQCMAAAIGHQTGGESSASTGWDL